MNVAGLGVVSSFAGSSLAQRTASTEPASQEATQQQRQADSAQAAEAAAGIGQTNEDHESTDRDADGRRPWELEERRKATEAEQAAATPTLSLDPTGQLGAGLDLLA